MFYCHAHGKDGGQLLYMTSKPIPEPMRRRSIEPHPVRSKQAITIIIMMKETALLTLKKKLLTWK